jgi:hypothetical protein
MTRNLDRLGYRKLWVFYMNMSTIGWIGCDNFVATTIGYVGSAIGTIGLTCSTWMLSIAWSRLGSGSSSRLPYPTVVWSFPTPPPRISSEQVRFSSSFESTTYDLKVVLDFFLGGEATNLRLNLSLSVGGSMHIFSRWD